MLYFRRCDTFSKNVNRFCYIAEQYYYIRLNKALLVFGNSKFEKRSLLHLHRKNNAQKFKYPIVIQAQRFYLRLYRVCASTLLKVSLFRKFLRRYNIPSLQARIASHKNPALRERIQVARSFPLPLLFSQLLVSLLRWEEREKRWGVN